MSSSKLMSKFSSISCSNCKSLATSQLGICAQYSEMSPPVAALANVAFGASSTNPDSEISKFPFVVCHLLLLSREIVLLLIQLLSKLRPMVLCTHLPYSRSPVSLPLILTQPSRPCSLLVYRSECDC